MQARLNCLVSGGTGSGKTTFLNVLSSFLPDRERIVTIEDAAELLLNQSHVVRLESRPPNVEGTGEIRIRDLFRNALRMRPDRIIIGECRGAEALDMLQAMNTGHDGSLTTIHANSQRDALSRIETMVLMAGFDLPVRAIREQIASALDIVVHTARMRDGSRKVLGVSEVVGMEGDIVTMQEVVRFAQHGVDDDNKVVGDFCYTGVQPVSLKRFAEYGVSVRSSRPQPAEADAGTMVTALVPIAVFAGVTATVFFAFYSIWNQLNERANARVRGLSEKLDRAGIRLSSQEIVLTVSAVVIIAWISIVLVMHTSLVLSLVLLAVIVAIAVLGFSGFVQFCMQRRLDAFITQLEPAMRLIGGGLRVGLGLRQSLAIVIDELPDPARYEFRRVIGQTNIGVSIYDAIDDLAARMPSHESMMISRVFRVQAETGGDLARILDQLADTIKARRQVQRKTSSLTAEGRMSAWVLMAIPVALGAFIASTQPNMSHALLYTWIGHIVIGLVLGLEVMAYFSLKVIMKMDV